MNQMTNFFFLSVMRRFLAFAAVLLLPVMFFISGCSSSSDCARGFSSNNGPRVAPTNEPVVPVDPARNMVSTFQVMVLLPDGMPLDGVLVTSSNPDVVVGNIYTDANGQYVFVIQGREGQAFDLTFTKNKYVISSVHGVIDGSGTLQPDGSRLYQLLATAYMPMAADVETVRASTSYPPTIVYLWDNSLVVDPQGRYLYMLNTSPYVLARIDITNITGASKDTVAVLEPTKLDIFAGSREDGASGTVVDGIGEAAEFVAPWSLAISPDGKMLYTGDQYCIRSINTVTKEVKTIAGNPLLQGSNDATGSAAGIYSDASYGLVVSPDARYLYFLDENAIRRLEIQTNKVVTLAGVTSVSGSSNGDGDAARFGGPISLVITNDGKYLYTLDGQNIRKITVGSDKSSTQVETLTVTPALAGVNNSYSGLSISNDNNTLYVSEYDNKRITTVNLTAKTTKIIAGDSSFAGGNAVDGFGTQAGLMGAMGMALTPDNKYLFFVDSCPHYVRMMNLQTEEVSTILGGQCKSIIRPGYVMPTAMPYHIALTSDDKKIYVSAPSEGSQLYTLNLLLDQFLNFKSIAGSMNGYLDGTGHGVKFSGLDALALAKDDSSLYIYDKNNYRIRKMITATNAVAPFIGTGTSGTNDGGAGAATVSGSVTDMAVSKDGSLLYFTDGGKLRQVTLTGMVTVSTLPVTDAKELAVSKDGLYLYYSTTATPSTIKRFTISSNTVTPLSLVDSASSPFSFPANVTAMAITSNGESLFASTNRYIYVINLNTNTCKKMAGTDTNPNASVAYYKRYDIIDGTDGMTTYFGNIYDIKLSSDDAALYVSDNDYYTNVVRRIVATQ